MWPEWTETHLQIYRKGRNREGTPHQRIYHPHPPLGASTDPRILRFGSRGTGAA
jgi:hypothetical protein